MKQGIKLRRAYALSVCFFLLFLSFTVFVDLFDVQAIGVEGTEVGLATVNTWVFNTLGGEHPILISLTEILGYLLFVVAGGFGLFGVWQWIKRKSLRKIDSDLFVLAGLYVLVVAFYAAFELIAINYRPIMLEETPEASYPSSHTLFAITIMGSAVLQLRARIKKDWMRRAAVIGCLCLMTVIVVGRFLSGVHWFSDIAGGCLLGGALLSLYAGTVEKTKTGKSTIG